MVKYLNCIPFYCINYQYLSSKSLTFISTSSLYLKQLCTVDGVYYSLTKSYDLTIRFSCIKRRLWSQCGTIKLIWHVSSGKEVTTIVVCLVLCWVVMKFVFGPGWTKQKTLLQWLGEERTMSNSVPIHLVRLEDKWIRQEL